MIRVLIERRLAEGAENAFRRVMQEMRIGAVQATGYISGETLCEAGNPSHWVIISTWWSREDWDAWASSAARKHGIEQMAPLLAEPERSTVLEPT